MFKPKYKFSHEEIIRRIIWQENYNNNGEITFKIVEIGYSKSSGILMYNMENAKKWGKPI